MSEKAHVIASLERIYGVELVTDDDLQRLADRLGLPVPVLLMPTSDLEKVATMLKSS